MLGEGGKSSPFWISVTAVICAKQTHAVNSRVLWNPVKRKGRLSGVLVLPLKNVINILNI